MDDNELLRRVNELSDQINRIKIYLIENSNIPDDDFWKEEIYTESYKDKKSVYSDLCIIFEHLLKLKYCTNNRCYDDWIKTVIEHQSRIIHLVDYVDKPDKLLLNHLVENFDNAYLSGVKYYIDAEKKYPDLQYNDKFIPLKSPFNLDSVLTLSIPDLLDKLPDPDELTTQMQLYPFCKLYKGSYTQMWGKFCWECGYQAVCNQSYKERRENNE